MQTASDSVKMIPLQGAIKRLFILAVVVIVVAVGMWLTRRNRPAATH